MHKDRNEQPNLLETERLWLRYLCADDADFMVELLNEPGFLQNVCDRGIRNATDASRYIWLALMRATSNSALACIWWGCRKREW